MKRFLIFRTDKLGDFIIISNLIKKIKKKYLNSHITIVCSMVNYKLIKQYDLVDKIYVYKKKSSFREKLVLLKKIAKKQYFASFSLDGKTYSNIVNIFIRSKYKLGVSYKFNLFFKYFFWSKPNFFFNKLFFDYYVYFTSKNDLNKIEHIPSIINNLIKMIGLHTSITEPYFFQNTKLYNREFISIFKKRIKSPYILIHMDEKWNDIKNIRYELFDALNFLQKRLKKKIVISSFKNKFEYFFNLKKKLHLNKNIINLENLNIFLLERFINKSYFVISCHSGYVVQISGANKTPVFDIINKKDFLWYSCWKPLNTFHKFIYKSNLRSNFSINKVFTNILNLTYSI